MLSRLFHPPPPPLPVPPVAMDLVRPALRVQLARRAADIPPLAIITAIGNEASAAPVSVLINIFKTFFYVRIRIRFLRSVSPRYRSWYNTGASLYWISRKQLSKILLMTLIALFILSKCFLYILGNFGLMKIRHRLHRHVIWKAWPGFLANI